MEVFVCLLTFNAEESIEACDICQLTGMNVPLLEDAVDVVVGDGLRA